jgi:hypothetical protein
MVKMKLRCAIKCHFMRAQFVGVMPRFRASWQCLSCSRGVAEKNKTPLASLQHISMTDLR